MRFRVESPPSHVALQANHSAQPDTWQPTAAVGGGVGAGVVGGRVGMGVGEGVGLGVGAGVGAGVVWAGVGEGVGEGVGLGVGAGDVGEGVMLAVYISTPSHRDGCEPPNAYNALPTCVCARTRACVPCACVRVRVGACLRMCVACACARACVCACMCVHVCAAHRAEAKEAHCRRHAVQRQPHVRVRMVHLVGREVCRRFCWVPSTTGEYEAADRCRA